MAKLPGTKPPDLYCIDIRCQAVTRHASVGTTIRHGCECEKWRCAWCKRVTRLLGAVVKDS